MFVAQTHRRLDMHYTSAAHKEKEEASESGNANFRSTISSFKKNCGFYKDTAMANFANSRAI